MSVEDELSMGEATPVKTVESDESVELSLSEAELDEVLAKRELDAAAKDFDLQAWIEGARSGRASVRLYARADLDHWIEEAAADLFEAMKTGRKADQRKIEQRLIKLHKQYFDSGIDIVLEERSKDWQARKTLELKQAGVEGEKAIALELIAAQIVQPPDSFTGEDLAGLAEVIPRQINSLISAWAKLSGQTETKGLPTF